MQSLCTLPTGPAAGCAGGPSARALPERGQRHGRERTCIGCGQKVALATARAELVRIVQATIDGEVRLVADLTGRSDGRGAWVHPRARCLQRAAERGLARSLGVEARLGAAQLGEAIRAAAQRRVAGLLATARRTRALALGATAVERAWQRDEARLVLVAVDAAAAARLGVVRQAGARGMAVVWATKELLGQLVPGSEADVAVVALTSEPLAAAVRKAVALAALDVEAGSTAPQGGRGRAASARRPRPGAAATPKERTGSGSAVSS